MVCTPDDLGSKVLIHPPDLFLVNLLEMLPSQNYTVLYTTTRSGTKAQVHDEKSPLYEMDYSMSPLAHIELKRDVDFHTQTSPTNGTINAPLFERYQFFTPGLCIPGPTGCQ